MIMLSRRQGLTAAASLATTALITPASRAADSANLAARPLSRMDLPWWKARFAAKQKEIASGPWDIAFYGDSITQDFERNGPEPYQNFAPIWAKHFGGPGRRALNLGYNGDATCHLLWRILNGESQNLSPRAAVILIGANNFGKLHWPAEPTARGITTIITTLRARLPKTRLLLLGVLPSIRSPWVDAQTLQLNASLARTYGDHQDPMVSYQDLGAIFRAGGSATGAVDPGKFLDPNLKPPAPPLHPNPEAAAEMLAAIAPWVTRSLA